MIERICIRGHKAFVGAACYECIKIRSAAFNRKKRRQDGDSVRAKDRMRKRDYYKDMYGISREIRDAIWERQGGLCWICQTATFPYSPSSLKDSAHLDHFGAPHKKCQPRDIRAILCRTCNVGIGYFEKKGISISGHEDYYSSRPHYEYIKSVME